MCVLCSPNFNRLFQFFADMSCISKFAYLDPGSFGCLFVDGCIASGCKVVIKCDHLSTLQQEPYVFNLKRSGRSIISEPGYGHFDTSNGSCTTNLVLLYATYSNSHSDVPDKTLTNINLSEYSTSTSESFSSYL